MNWLSRYIRVLRPAEVRNRAFGDSSASYPPSTPALKPTPLVRRASSGKLRGQPENVHLFGARRGVDVGVRRERDRPGDRPRLSPANQVEKRDRPVSRHGGQVLVAEGEPEVMRGPHVPPRPEVGQG